MPPDMDRLRNSLFDEEMAPALAELEEGPRPVSHLAHICGVSADAIRERFAYLVEQGFLTVRDDTYTANAEKLSGVMESEDYTGIEDGVAVMDSYLN